MQENKPKKVSRLYIKMKNFIEETDTSTLVNLAAFIGPGGFLVSLLLFILFTGGKGQVPSPVIPIAMGIAGLVASFAGFVEIYKREVPGPFGRIIEGKPAIISGILMIIIFGIPGVGMLLYGLFSLLFTK